MRSKDFPFVYSWEERKPLLNDNVLFIPEYYFLHKEYSMPSLYNIFKTDNAVNLEICSGNGEWVVNRALLNSNINWIAVECRLDRLKKIWSKTKNNNLKNILLVFGKAQLLCKYYLEKNSISNTYINFPTPFTRKREKHRLIKEDFIKDLHTVSKEGSTLSLVTDQMPYLENAINVINKRWKPNLKHPYYTNYPMEYGTSFFTKLFTEQNKPIYISDFEKISG